MADILDDIFVQLGVTNKSKLGNSVEEESRRANAELTFAERRREIQIQLKQAVQARAKTINRLNIAFYLIISFIIISIVLQFFVKGSNIIAFVQTACIAVLFPISRQIEKSVTKQSYIEFTSAFLPDLEPKEAIKAIDQLYHSINNPKSVKESINP
jgi:hypothetical protein